MTLCRDCDRIGSLSAEILRLLKKQILVFLANACFWNHAGRKPSQWTRSLE